MSFCSINEENIQHKACCLLQKNERSRIGAGKAASAVFSHHYVILLQFVLFPFFFSWQLHLRVVGALNHEITAKFYCLMESRLSTKGNEKRGSQTHPEMRKSDNSSGEDSLMQIP